MDFVAVWEDLAFLSYQGHLVAVAILVACSQVVTDQKASQGISVAQSQEVVDQVASPVAWSLVVVDLAASTLGVVRIPVSEVRTLVVRTAEKAASKASFMDFYLYFYKKLI